MPLTGERARCDLLREEKLLLYEHVRDVARQNNSAGVVSEQELLLLQDTKGTFMHGWKDERLVARLVLFGITNFRFFEK